MEKIFKIAIFASGNGSNAEAIIKHFSGLQIARVEIIISNNAKAFVIERAIQNNVPTFVFNKSSFYSTDEVLTKLNSLNIDLIILAGFLWLIPKNILNAFPDRIINIHPALLPKYGGKGMYGNKVHETVISSGDTESGITIHLVNDEYDKGKVLFQAKCGVFQTDTPADLANRIHQLEHQCFPDVIEDYLKSMPGFQGK